MLAAPPSRAAHPSAADIILHGLDTPLFPGCLVDVSVRRVWHRATVVSIDVCGSSGTIRVKRRSGPTVIINADDVPLRLRHCRHTMRAVRRLRRMLDRCDESRDARGKDQLSRVEKARAAGLKRNPLAHRRYFSELRESRRSRVDPNQLLSLDLCSGPFKSVSLAVNRHIDSALAVTVDIEETFAPDVAADLRVWDLWGFLLENCLSDKGRVHCFVHIHASPPCTTYVLLNNRVNTRTPAQPAAGPRSRPAAREADEVVRTIVFLIRQCARNGLPTTWSIENPKGSMLWKLPCMKQLLDDGLLELVRVDYCRYGNAGAKPTYFAVSPALSGERESWAWTCRRNDGNCGAFRRASPQASPYHGGPLSHKLIDSYIPATLCGLLSCAWVRIHSPQRCNDTSYCTLSVPAARKLQAEWLAFTTTNAASLTAKTLPLGRPRVGSGPPPSRASGTTDGVACSSTTSTSAPPPVVRSTPNPDAAPIGDVVQRALSSSPSAAANAASEELSPLSPHGPNDDTRSPPVALASGKPGLPVALRHAAGRPPAFPLTIRPVPAQSLIRRRQARAAPSRKRTAAQSTLTLQAPPRRRSSRRARVCSLCGSGGTLLGSTVPMCKTCAGLHSVTAPQQLRRARTATSAALPRRPTLVHCGVASSIAIAEAPGALALPARAVAPRTIRHAGAAPAVACKTRPAPPVRAPAASFSLLVEALMLESGDVIHSGSSAAALRR